MGSILVQDSRWSFFALATLLLAGCLQPLPFPKRDGTVVCTHGHKRCIGKRKVETCSPAGTWQHERFCQLDELCKSGVCVEIPGTCGDGKCQPTKESCWNCDKDCGSCCPNGKCEPQYKETCTSCPKDCTCVEAGADAGGDLFSDLGSDLVPTDAPFEGSPLDVMPDAPGADATVDVKPDVPSSDAKPDALGTDAAVDVKPDAPSSDTKPDAPSTDATVDAKPDTPGTDATLDTKPDVQPDTPAKPDTNPDTPTQPDVLLSPEVGADLFGANVG